MIPWSTLRSAVQRPALPFAAFLTLALGIGLAGTIFGFTYGTVLVDLPFEGRWVVAERLVNGDDTDGRVNAEDLHAWRAETRTVDPLFGYQTIEASLGDDAGPTERIAGARVETIGLSAMNVTPVLGRGFSTEEGRVGGPEVVLLGEGLWRRRFGGSAAVLGRTIRVDGVPRQVVGVMPAGFGFPVDHELWLPLRLDVGTPRDTAARVSVAGRLVPGISLQAAGNEIARLDDGLRRRFPATNSAYTARVQSYTTGTIGAEIVAFQLAMLGVAVLVLIVAAVNVANLLLARGASRTREFAVRAALGASRSGLVAQLLGETAVIAAAGGLGGIMLARVGLLRLTDAVIAGGINPFFWFDIGLTPATMAGIAGLSVLATLVAGIPPALQASRTAVGNVLKDEGRGTSSLRVGRFMRGLVVAQLALSMAILSVAGVMVRSMQTLRVRDYGFSDSGMLTGKVALPPSYTATARARFWDSLEREMAADRRIARVALTSALPVREFTKVQVVIGGREPARPEDTPAASMAAVSPEYFDVLGARLLEGRPFSVLDTGGTASVAIVNRSFWRRHFDGVSPLGASLGIISARGVRSEATIVGVAPDLWMDGPRNRRPEGVYLPLAQQDLLSARVLAVGVAGEPELRAAVADNLSRLDPDIPAYEVWPMEAVIARASFFYYFLPSLFLVFGAAALVLAAIGLYAVMTFAVQARRVEMGVRRALGATRPGVVTLVLRRVVGQVAVGLALGAAAGALLSQSLTRFLISANPIDSVTLASVGAVLAGVCVVATMGPAIWASRVNPVEALRTQ